MCNLLGRRGINAFPNSRLLAQSLKQLLKIQQKSFDLFMPFMYCFTSQNGFSSLISFTKNHGLKMVDFVEYVIDQSNASFKISFLGIWCSLLEFRAVSIVTMIQICSGFLEKLPLATLRSKDLIHTAGFRKTTAETVYDHVIIDTSNM